MQLLKQKLHPVIRSLVLQNTYNIENSWKPITKKIITYNNKLVDDVIINDAVINITTVNEQINKLFEPNVLKTYQAILKSPLVESSYTNKIWLEGTAKQITDMVSVEYTERIGKNIEAIQKILQDVNINISKYEEMTAKFPGADRLKIVEKAMEKGENWKGHTYSYKELDNMNRGITKYIDNKAEFDKYSLNHDEAMVNGETPAKLEKMWVWSGLQNTRHSGMDGETVALKDFFTVENEQNGDIDELLFPGDFNNDRNSCSNICNCQCGVVYL
jgi:hypothetical protein